MQVAVKNFKNEEGEKVSLNKAIFGVPFRADILTRVVNWQRAKKQAGTHQTKGISQIAGTTAKPHAQKGTGRARQGSTRSAQMRGGAVIFGPITRSHAFKLPKKVRALGLKIALSGKAKDGSLIVIDDLKKAAKKTKDLILELEKMDLKNALFIDGAVVDENFVKASSNIPYIDVLPAQGANVYSILRREKLVLTKAALEALDIRFGEKKAAASAVKEKKSTKKAYVKKAAPKKKAVKAGDK
ncbi:MAG: 50S ribosomal protein L4 [Alphaproteobacteria bacterium]